MMDTLYTPAEIAELLKLKKTTIYDLIKRGELPSSKVGKQLRISGSDLAQYLNQASQTPVQPESSPLKKDYLQNNSGLVLSGQTSILDLLCTILENHPKGLPVLRSYMNSYNSLYSLYFEKVHAAVCGLWNDSIKDFDFTMLTHFLPGLPVTVIHLCKYRLGFFIKKGNPKQIDVKNCFSAHGLHIVNRERGSEPRRLMDILITGQGQTPSQIQGYSKELLSHASIAAHVAAGHADVGIGSENTLSLYQGLDFIPLETGSVDLVMPSGAVRSIPGLDLLMEITTSREFKDSLSLVAGYDTAETGRLLLS